LEKYVKKRQLLIANKKTILWRTQENYEQIQLTVAKYWSLTLRHLNNELE